MTGMVPGAVTAIEDAFRDAGVTGSMYAVDLDGGHDLGVRPDAPVATASIFKLPLLVTFFRQVAAGHVDPAAICALKPDGRPSGPTGISVMRDEVSMSLRDLAALMTTVSDNAAADAIFARVGIGTVNATLTELGLHETHVECCCADLFESMLVDAGVKDFGELWSVVADPAVRRRLRALDPARTSRSTPRETARLLGMIWRDEVAPPTECAEMRRLLGLQVWPHRLASGFPFDDVKVSGKTGTLPTVRNEAGVVEYPDGRRYAVAVFTRAALPAAVLPRADAVIGTAARLAVEGLRRS